MKVPDLRRAWRWLARNMKESAPMKGSGRIWTSGLLLNCETFFVEIQGVVAVTRVNLVRIVEGTERTMDGLQITFASGRQIEVDCLSPEHRDQVYDALFDAKAKLSEIF